MGPEEIAIAILGVAVCILLGYLVGTRRRGQVAGTVNAAPVSLPPGAESLAPAFQTVLGQLNELRGTLDEVRTVAKIEEAREVERRRAQDQAYETLQRLSGMLQGSARSGATGERILRERLEALPAQWLIRNHAVSGQPVEFAVKLPDGLILPIDSKVFARDELAELDREQDIKRREALEKRIANEAVDRAREVRKYVDERTPGFGIAAIPDAAYTVCGSVLPRAYTDHRVLVVPYGLVLPFVLMVFEQHRRSGVDLDSAQVAHLLADIESYLGKASQVLESHLGGAITQLGNARDKLKSELGAATHALELAHTSATAKVRA
jgi:DNA recombination protein RmuC